METVKQNKLFPLIILRGRAKIPFVVSSRMFFSNAFSNSFQRPYTRYLQFNIYDTFIEIITLPDFIEHVKVKRIKEISILRGRC